MHASSLVALAASLVVLGPLASTAEPVWAHERSRFAIIDPVYSVTSPRPRPQTRVDRAPWLYGEAELECWRLQQLRARVKAARLNVGYPGVFHQACPHVTFRLAAAVGQSLPERVSLRAVGEVWVKWGGRTLYHGAAKSSSHKVELRSAGPTGIQSLQVELRTAGEPPAILIDRGPLATDIAPWEWSADGTHWSRAVGFPQLRSGIPPHQGEAAATVVAPIGREGELYDFGRELIGQVTFRAAGQPGLFVGESMAEARNSDPRHFEQSLKLVAIGKNQWISEHPLAFRYVRIANTEAKNVECRAFFEPAQYRGAFACSDERLTQIWMRSAYTHRLCGLDFVLDGIKRDRLPWVDNMILSAAVASYAFGDPEPVRRTLTVMGRTADTSHINGIVDYNFLWVIAHQAFQEYFDDPDYLRREWPRIRAMLERMVSQCDDDGLVRPAGNEWVFIDWVDFDKNTSLQLMWVWAQRAGAMLAERLGETAAAIRWNQRADALEHCLRVRAWDPTASVWRDPDKAVPPSRHAHVLAVNSGLAKPDQYPGVLAFLRAGGSEPLNSPSMVYYEILALAQLGDTALARGRLREVWGTMLERGATTFWEGFSPDESGADAYAFYGRPFGKSLCHAWGAGPVVLLPRLVLGLRPTADGWKRFVVAPKLGDLEWACATVPTPRGDIQVSVENGWIHLRVPPGTVAQCEGNEFAGPRDVRVSAPGR